MSNTHKYSVNEAVELTIKNLRDADPSEEGQKALDQIEAKYVKKLNIRNITPRNPQHKYPA